jgi:hypothetical protein
MRILACLLFFWMVLGAPVQAYTTQPGDPVIIMPRSGEALQGMVIIEVATNVSGFAFAEIAFTFVADPTGTWFPIATSSQPITNGTMSAWDTTVISDGEYTLRLRVTLTDGSFRDAIVSSVRVRNYTAVETNTPAMIVPNASPLPTSTPTPTPLATPTLLPHNPAVFGSKDVSNSILYGGMTAIAIFAIFSIYLWMRRKFS